MSLLVDPWVLNFDFLITFARLQTQPSLRDFVDQQMVLEIL
jgi:hypothetical protein